MAEQILQCPECQARYRARSYEPGNEYACQKCGGQLVLTSAADRSAQTIIPQESRDSEPDDDPLPGEQIGQYKILSRIGAGGMGTV